ncbi:MAG: hypothetical protein M3Y56_07355 [Armatimonadota bacterium]|nr:hypothetical protein [Armatimonadota bacterium]
MSERRQPSRRSQGSAIPGKLLKGFTLLLFTGFGYLLGLKVIGPGYGGHASTLPASTGAAVRHASSKPTTTPSAGSNAGADSDEPTAVITPGRHTAVVPDGDTHAADRTPRDPDASVTPHHHKVRPAVNTSTKPAKEAVGDQSVLPVDKASVGGADNEPSGAAHSSHHLDTPNIDSGLPGAGDESGGGRTHSGGSDRGAPRTHHSDGESTRHSDPRLPGADENLPGDTTPITPRAGGRSHKNGGADRSTGTEGRSRHWMAADRASDSAPIV